jgi:hypothetical protein
MRRWETVIFNLPARREHLMRRVKVVFTIVGTVMLCLWAVSGKGAQNNFSGTWVVDKDKTHGLPSGLKNYTMVVTQTEQQLVVQTKVEGDLRPPEGGPPGGPEGGWPEGGPPPGGPEGGPPGGPEGAGPPSGTMALRMVIPNATYSLAGEETMAELEHAGRGAARLKAKWSKDGKTLELSSVREVNFGGNSETIMAKERWTLSEGGEVLRVQRSVETPMGTDLIKLTFRKGQAEPQAAEH